MRTDFIAWNGNAVKVGGLPPLACQHDLDSVEYHATIQRRKTETIREKKGELKMYRLSFFTLFFMVLVIWSMGALYFKKEDMSWFKAFKTSLEKAVDWFITPKQSTVEYPVYIGIDDWGYPLADVIEKEFFPVLKNFVSSYFKKYIECRNRLEYYFFVDGFKLDIVDDWEKIKYLRGIAEQFVHQYIHKNYPSFGAIPNNLVALNFSDDTLFISIAKNTAGIVENEKYMDALRKKLKQNSQPKNSADVDVELEKELEGMENNGEHEN